MVCANHDVGRVLREMDEGYSANILEATVEEVGVPGVWS